MPTQQNEPEVEKAVLGAILLDESCILDAADVLTSDDFYSSSHGDIFASCVSLAAENSPHDMIAVTHQLRVDGRLEAIGGVSYLSSLIDAIPDVANVKHYARIIKDCAVKRRLLTLGEKLVNGASSSAPAAEILDKAQAGLMEVAVGSEKASERGPEIADRVLDFSSPTQHARNRTEWPLRSISDLTGGVGAGQLIIVAGRPKTGKSALGVQMAHHVAKMGIGVHVASLEMVSDELMARILSMESRVNLTKILHHSCNENERERLGSARRRLPDKMWIDDRPGQTLLQIRAQARKTQARHNGLGLIVVDYLTLMGGRMKGWSREETVQANVQGLKNLAKDLQAPVLLLAQLNRGPDRENREPRMSDLRESGASEQAADIVLLIHRSAEQEERTAKIICAAQRHGPIGSCKVIYEGEHTCFTDMDPWEGMK